MEALHSIATTLNEPFAIFGKVIKYKISKCDELKMDKFINIVGAAHTYFETIGGADNIEMIR